MVLTHIKIQGAFSMQVFEASDIVEIAIRIEENGTNFYKFAEQIAKEEEAKKNCRFGCRRNRPQKDF